MLHTIIPKKICICLIFILIFCIPFQSFSGRLDDFEKDATKHREKKSYHSDNQDEQSTGITKGSRSRSKKHGDSNISGLIAKFILGRIAYGGVASLMRINPSLDKKGSFNITPREKGETAIPFFRTDICRQHMDSNLYALDYRVEAGYGPFAIHFNQTRYHEKHPDDELDLVRIYGVYRMSSSRFVECGLGFGTLIMDGEKSDSGFSFTMPLTVKPVKYVGVEFRPSWSDINGSSIEDYDIALRLGTRYAFLKAGYRWLQSPRESLNGPYVGIAVHY